MLSPFAPHIAEEIWEKLGNSELASKSAWPSSIGIEIDSKSIQTETLLKSIIEDINNILKVTKISPKKITIYTAEQWKSKAYNSILKNVLDGQTNIGTIIKSLIANKETEQIKKDPDFVKKTLNDILSEPVELRKGRMNIGQIDEKQIISSELSSLVKNDYDVELSVFSESDSEKYDPKNKAKAARPFKPAILIE
jgi:leucyl-tRNA synthetase